MDNVITATDLARGLSDVLNRVRYKGEQFAIDRTGERIAILSPAVAPARITLRELAARLGDLSLPGDGFADDLEAVQSSQPVMVDPVWPN